MRHTPTLGLAVVAIIAVSAACGVHSATNKTGDQNLVIRLASPDAPDPNGLIEPVFVRKLEQVSGGAIKVQVVGNYEPGLPTAESDMIAAIGKGEFDAGIPTVRAFAAAGHPGFQAVEAPFLVTSGAAEAAIVTGQVAKDLLKTLDGTDVVSLGIVAGVLRRPFGLTPMRNPAEWKGQRVRYLNSRVQAETIAALGGTPVLESYHFDELVRAGQLEGAETDLETYDNNGYDNLLPAVVRNVVLWPRMTVLTFNRKLVERLSSVQRGWLQQAADADVQTSAMYKFDDSIPAADVCAWGVRFYDASPADVAALTAAVQPVYARIAADPVAGPLLAEVKEVAAAHPGVDVPKVPPGCVLP
jgi:TRAP-type C4-dicarboxylate transport system substrate-binding protein